MRTVSTRSIIPKICKRTEPLSAPGSAAVNRRIRYKNHTKMVLCYYKSIGLCVRIPLLSNLPVHRIESDGCVPYSRMVYCVGDGARNYLTDLVSRQASTRIQYSQAAHGMHRECRVFIRPHSRPTRDHCRLQTKASSTWTDADRSRWHEGDCRAATQRLAPHPHCRAHCTHTRAVSCMSARASEPLQRTA